jgi:hypothetical protein
MINMLLLFSLSFFALLISNIVLNQSIIEKTIDYKFNQT